MLSLPEDLVSHIHTEKCFPFAALVRLSSIQRRAREMGIRAQEPLQARKDNNGSQTSFSTTSSRLLYAYQWVLLLLLCPPLLLASIILALPIAMLLWFSGAVAAGKTMAAKRDPIFAQAMEVEEGPYASLAAFGRVYTSLVAFGFHQILRIFVVLGRPRTVFVVYLSNFHLMRKFFCVGTSELIWRAGLFKGAM